MLFIQLFNNRFCLVFLIPFILGGLSVLMFQPFNLTFLGFLIIPSLFLLITHVCKKSKNIYRKKPYLTNLFYIGFLFGVGFFLSGTYWISYSLTFDENFRYLIPFSLILIPLFLGVFPGLGTLMIGPFLRNDIGSILIFCSSLSFMDYLRSKIFTGFPWNLWAYSWSSYAEILQILNPIGLFSFNLLTLTIFCTPLLLIFKKKNNLTIFFTLISLFFFNYIYGSYVFNKEEKNYNKLILNKDNSTYIKLISPNFDLKYNISQSELDILVNKLIRYSEPIETKETIFIWPEGVFTGHTLTEIKKYKFLFEKKFSKKHIIIFGVNTRDDVTNEYFNTLVAINNSFEVIYRYDKKKLVPFGEFLPFENFLNKLSLKKITQGYGSFTKGLLQDNLIIGNLNILPLICYEIIFTELSQKSSIETNLIVNISEDAWFGSSIGPHQHFAKAIYRAIESNTFLVRSANRGISAFINNRGKVIRRLEPNETGNIELNIPLITYKLKNRNDLIFFILLFTYIFIFFYIKKKTK